MKKFIIAASFFIAFYLTAAEYRTARVETGDVPINAVWSGADRTGLTDSSTAIQAAINRAATNGEVVHLPPGTYLITNTITLAKDVHLRGVSSKNNPTLGTTIKLADGAECDMIVFPAGSWNAKLESISLDGNRTNQVSTNLCGIKMNNTTGDTDMSKLDDVYIRDVAGYGIYCTRREVTFQEVKVVRSYVGIYTSAAYDSVWDNVYVGHCNGDGIYLFNSGGTFFDIASYNNTGSGLVIDQCANMDFYRTMIDACGKHGLDITITVDGHYCKNITFFGGRISCNGQSVNDTYSNVHFGGAGTGSYVTDLKFIGLTFWTDVVDMDTLGIWPKYIIHDERTYTGWLAGDKITLLGCQIATANSPLNTKHFATSLYSTGFENRATMVQCDDYNGTAVSSSLIGSLGLRTGRSLEWSGSVPVKVTGETTAGTISLNSQQVYLGPTTTNTPASYSLRLPQSVGENKNGSILNIISGNGTGTGVGGKVNVYVASSGSAGTNANSHTLRTSITTDRINLVSGMSLTHMDGAAISWGSVAPEGVHSGYQGSIYINTNGGVGATMYIKESGSGNTGWVLK